MSITPLLKKEKDKKPNQNKKCQGGDCFCFSSMAQCLILSYISCLLLNSQDFILNKFSPFIQHSADVTDKFQCSMQQWFLIALAFIIHKRQEGNFFFTIDFWCVSLNISLFSQICSKTRTDYFAYVQSTFFVVILIFVS